MSSPRTPRNSEEAEPLGGSTRKITNIFTQQPKTSIFQEIDLSEISAKNYTVDAPSIPQPPRKPSLKPTPVTQANIAEIPPKEVKRILGLPVSNWPMVYFKRIQINTIKSFHKVFQCYKVKSINAVLPGKLPTTYFYKINRPGSAISGLESTISRFYRRMTPHHAASTRPIFDYTVTPLTNPGMSKIEPDTIRRVRDKKEILGRITGVMSKALKGFKSQIESPLRAEDLIISSFKKPLSIKQLDQLDKEAQRENIDLEKNQYFHSFPAKDLINYRIKKGLARGLVNSFVFQEDDLHRGNMSKDGKRIDFDMSLWPILYDYKESPSFWERLVSQPLDWAFRKPAERFKVTARDIRNFPDLQDASPFYWPTKEDPYVGRVRSVFSFLPLQDNAYSAQENKLFKSLQHDEIFNYHKYSQLLKFILSDPQEYAQMAMLDIPDLNLIKRIKTHMGERIKAFKEVLVKMPEFNQFLKEHGEDAFNEIRAETIERNVRINQKMEKNKDKKHDNQNELLISIETLRSDYENLAKITANNCKEPEEKSAHTVSMPGNLQTWAPDKSAFFATKPESQSRPPEPWLRVDQFSNK